MERAPVSHCFRNTFPKHQRKTYRCSILGQIRVCIWPSPFPLLHVLCCNFLFPLSVLSFFFSRHCSLVTFWVFGQLKMQDIWYHVFSSTCVDSTVQYLLFPHPSHFACQHGVFLIRHCSPDSFLFPILFSSASRKYLSTEHHIVVLVSKTLYILF